MLPGRMRAGITGFEWPLQAMHVPGHRAVWQQEGLVSRAPNLRLGVSRDSGRVETQNTVAATEGFLIG